MHLPRGGVQPWGVPLHLFDEGIVGNEVPDTVLIRECDVDVLTNQLFPDVDPARASDARRGPSLVPADDQINSHSFVGGWEVGVSGCDQRLDRLTHVGMTPRPQVIFIRPRLFDLTTAGFLRLFWLLRRRVAVAGAAWVRGWRSSTNHAPARTTCSASWWSPL